MTAVTRRKGTGRFTPHMQMLDSRRLTGPGLLLDRPGAVVEIKVDDDRRDAAITAWREAATRMLAAVGWTATALLEDPRAWRALLPLALGIGALFGWPSYPLEVMAIGGSLPSLWVGWIWLRSDRDS